MRRLCLLLRPPALVDVRFLVKKLLKRDDADFAVFLADFAVFLANFAADSCSFLYSFIIAVTVAERGLKI